MCACTHPNICKNWLKNGRGNGGCTKGKNCENLHLKICSHSLKDRTNPDIGSERKCDRGYHLNGTKPSDQNSGQKNSDQNSGRKLGPKDNENSKKSNFKTKSSNNGLNTQITLYSAVIIYLFEQLPFDKEQCKSL